MQILIADDDSSALLLLKSTLNDLGGYEVVAVQDGAAAWAVLQHDEPPALVLLDWTMPGLDGVEVCRKVRSEPRLHGVYLILVTGREGKEDLLTGLRAGANDYLTKPFDPAELEARVRVATRMVQLQLELSARVLELEDSLARVKRLETLLPICSYCKKIRDEQNHWHRIESYISSHSDTQFSHGICTECYETICEPELRELEAATLKKVAPCAF